MSTTTNGRATPPAMAPSTSSTHAWSVHDASELYEVVRWGNGYFSVNAHGHVQVHPTKEPSRGIDLKELVDRLQLRGIGLPVLVRFTDIVKHRLGEIHSAFQGAIAQHQYQGRYCCVYPIKVNQQRQVVEEVLDFGRPYRFGLEAGSKPELLAVVALAFVLAARTGVLTPDDTTLLARYGTPNSHFIDVDGQRVHYRDEGTGPAIVLVHGSFGSLRMWDSWVPALADHYRRAAYHRCDSMGALVRENLESIRRQTGRPIVPELVPE